MSTRTATVFVLLALAIAVVAYGSTMVFAGMILVVACLTAFEVFQLLGYTRPRLLASVGAATFLGLLPNSRIGSAEIAGAAAMLMFALAIIRTPATSIQSAVARVANSLFVWIYVFWTLGLAIPLRAETNGKALVGFTILFVSTRSIAANWLGRRVAGHSISLANPRKTYEGALIGALAASVLALPVGIAAGLELTRTLGLCVLFGIAGQLGDLAASMLKRIGGAQDSGRLLPGQGGMLDAVDSFLFCVPVALCYNQFT